ncbi:universal stress protein UspA [Novosphingobium barchaimii LL02]|uniref:Universal stress protein UspA n=1 Tax=Novosphingobium barchaimii LL02 TaxID=1114963 RepID=A0A0J7XLR2_9SPHN|nr:universal stress protein [Novosphingobium barchaimii]KMS52589.1 universal stress protein UspA [Novosphingobium barchaimii LL02]
MRSILVNADRKPGRDARIATAADIARRAEGHVTVLVDTPVSRYIAMDPMGGSYVLSDALEKAREDDDTVATTAETQLAGSGVAFDVVRCEDDPVTALAYAARLADLVVVSRSGGLAGDLALTSRTPILVLADDRPLTLPIRQACIAWDGGEQAAAALRASLPLLMNCESVKLISVIEKQGGFPANDALRYLARHGVNAEYEEHERRDSTEKTLAIAVTQAHADLLVMGAYGKSRLREFLFGGVTAYFLGEDGGPTLLLAH